MIDLNQIFDLYLNYLPFLLSTMFYVIPILVGIIGWQLYLYYIRYKWVKKLDRILLEIKLPKEILKSPAGIETLLAGMHQTSEGSLIDKYLSGRLRSWFALEIVSQGGNVHFYINTEKKFRNLIESHIYSQYPEVVVDLVDDYVHDIPYGVKGADDDMHAMVYELGKDDPYPIKTYIDFGLDKEKQETSTYVDPLASILEFFGNIQPYEQMWLQIMIMAAKDRKPKPEGKWHEKLKWQDEGKKIIEDLSSRKTESGFPKFLTKDSEKVVEAIGRKISKLGFDTGLRMLYFAPKDKMNGAYKGSMPTMFKQFNTLDLNEIKGRYSTSFDYPWEDMFGIRLSLMKARIFNAYRLRSYFWMPYPEKPFVLNTEELATLFHFVGSHVSTPTIERIMSKRSEPPADLPI